MDFRSRRSAFDCFHRVWDSQKDDDPKQRYAPAYTGEHELHSRHKECKYGSKNIKQSNQNLLNNSGGRDCEEIEAQQASE